MKHKKMLLVGALTSILISNLITDAKQIEVYDNSDLVYVPLLVTHNKEPTPSASFHVDVIKETISKPAPEISSRPRIKQLASKAKSVLKYSSEATSGVNRVGKWINDPEISWYGPCCYGNRTACGFKYTKEILGVAHRSLPCGTKVEFRYEGKSIVVSVIDRGPYVEGRIWDLSRATCIKLDHCFTGPIQYRIVSK